MKRLFFILGLAASVGLSAQFDSLTHKTYGTQPRDQINNNFTEAADSLAQQRADMGSLSTTVTDTALYTDFTVAKTDSGLYTADGYASMFDLSDALNAVLYETLFCDEYKVMYDSMTVKPIYTANIAYNRYISTLVDSGYLARADFLYILAMNNDANARRNWVNIGTYDLTNTNTSPTHVAYEGFTAASNDDVLSTGFDVATNGVNMSLDDQTLAAYSRSSSTAVDGSIIGFDETANDSWLSYFQAGLLYGRLSVASSLQASVAGDGFLLTTRRADNDIELYRGSTSVANGTTASTAESTYDFYVLGRNVTGGAAGSFYTDMQISIVIGLDGVTDGQAASLNVINERLMDDLGKGVQ